MTRPICTSKRPLSHSVEATHLGLRSDKLFDYGAQTLEGLILVRLDLE
jgi:hypothetical protein